MCLVVFLAAILGVLFAHYLFAGSWVEPIAGVRLEPVRPNLLEKEIQPDSCVDLLRRSESALATNKPSIEEITKILIGSPLPEQLLAADTHLSANAQALEIARRAAAAPDPQMVTPEVIGFPSYLSGLTDVFRLFRLSAARNAREENYARAFDECESLLRLSDSLSRGGTLIHRLVEISGEAIACNTIRSLALTHEIPEPTAQKMIEALLRVDREMEPWAEAFRYERLYGKNAVKIIYTPGALGSFVGGMALPGGPVTASAPFLNAVPIVGRLFGSNPTTTAKNLDNLYTHLIKLAEQPYDAKAIEAFQKRFDLSSGYTSLLLSRDPIGRFLGGTSMPVFLSVFERHWSRIVDLRGTAAVLAIRQFEQANGRPPATLDEIIPRWLPQMPLDPFNGKTLRYFTAKNGWLVYSVGPNQTDEHGFKPKYGRAKPNQPGDIVYTGDDAADEQAKLNKGAS